MLQEWTTGLLFGKLGFEEDRRIDLGVRVTLWAFGIDPSVRVTLRAFGAVFRVRVTPSGTWRWRRRQGYSSGPLGQSLVRVTPLGTLGLKAATGLLSRTFGTVF